MNPTTATLRSTDLCALLGVSDQSLYRWLARPYPMHHVPNHAPRGRTYALPEIVERLRLRRGTGLAGGDLAKLLDFDTHVRVGRGDDFLWLGDDVQDRADSFFAALDGEETERARSCIKTVRAAAVAAGLSGINRLGQIALIHPSLVRFILCGQAEELPVGDSGWASFVKAIWAVNPFENKEVA